MATTQRSPLMPQVPTFVESGHADFEFAPWVGLVAPAALNEATAARLRARLSGYAGLLSPTTPQFAFVFDDPVPVNQADFTAMANVAGLPAAAFPSGLAGGMDGGLPLSVQVMAWTEADALDLAQALARPVFTPPDFAG